MAHDRGATSSISVNGSDRNKHAGEYYEVVVDPSDAGKRLDLFLADLFPNSSRSAVSNLIRSGSVRVQGETSKAGYRIKEREKIEVAIPPPMPLEIVPEKVLFEVIHEDDELIVLAKPPGIVVHPACGHQTGTLVHGLVYHCVDLPGIGGEQRPGIVHRLDKDTSGVMVVAKDERTHQALVSLFMERKVEKTYMAVLRGRPKSSQGEIIRPIGRHPVNRKKMAVLETGGREAITRWRVLEEFSSPYTYVELRPETGRTHQLRVHMASLGHPIVGDALYGKKEDSRAKIPPIKRQCLHAFKMSFVHPGRGEKMTFIAPLWPDMAEVLRELRNAK